MSIPFIDGFEINRAVPVDKRMTATLFTDLQNITFAYSGLTTYVVETDAEYLWNGSSWRLKSGSGGTQPFASSLVAGIVKIGSNINVAVDGTISVNIPNASQITQDASNRFVSDTQISLWTNKESSISQGTTSQFFSWDKTWRIINSSDITEDSKLFFTEARVRATPLTGLSLSTTNLSATDDLITALGKLQGQLNAKESSLSAGLSTQYYRGDKTWQTLDKAAVGLSNVVNLNTSTTSNITDSLNKRFATDAQLAALGNISGINTGDETQATIKSKLGVASGTSDGYLSTSDWLVFNGKQAQLTFTPENVANKDVDGTLAANSDQRYPSQKAVKTYSTTILNQAKSYADSLVVGLWDDRGSYDASSNTFPTTGGSGIAGAILKGDIWTINVIGTLGGILLSIGDTVRALADTPGQTSSNWGITSHSIGYVAENVVNKDTDITLASNSDIKYASQKAVKTYIDTALLTKLSTSSTTDVISEGSTNKYFSESRVLVTLLTGLSLSTNSTIASTDSILIALGKLQTQTNSRIVANTAITGATKTKITYDSKGLVTSASDATTADIADSSDKRYVTDAQRTVLSNTSGTNTGDQDLSNYITKNGTDRLMTQDEATKLSGIIEHYRGTFTSESLLIAGVTNGVAGDYAFVDEGLSGTTKLHVWDVQSGWISEGTNEIISVNGATGVVVLTTNEIADSTDKRYITDAQQSSLANLTGINTGDETQSSIFFKLGYTPENLAYKNQPEGYAGLDSSGLIPLFLIPDTLLGQVSYQGTWNANTDSPTLPDATTVKGNYYVTNTQGTYNSVIYYVGDWVISNGTIWEKVSNTDSVTSVAGRTGAVVLSKTDVGLANVLNIAQEPAMGNPSVNGYIPSKSTSGVVTWISPSTGGVVPTDNFVKWDTTNSYYRPYTDKTEAGGGASGGRFYGGTTNPTNTNRLNYDGNLHTYGVVSSVSTGISINGISVSGTGVYGTSSTQTGVVGQSSSGAGVYGFSQSSFGIYGLSTTGVSGIFNNSLGNTSDIVKFQLNSIDQCIINSSGIDLITGATYKINGVNILSSKQDTLVSGTNIKTINSTSLLGSGDITIASPINGILYWDGTAYNPYSTQVAGKFDSSSNNPTHANRLNYDGKLYSSANFAYNTEASGYSGYFYSTGALSSGVFGQGVTLGVRGNSVSGYGGYFSSDTGNSIYITNGGATSSSDLLVINRTGGSSINLTGNLINILDTPSTSGTVSGSILKATCDTTVRIDMNPRVIDGSSAVAYTLDTNNTLSLSNLLSLRTNGTDKFTFHSTGYLNIFNNSTNYSVNQYNYYSIYYAGGVVTKLTPSVADGATSIAYLFDTSSTLSTAGCKLSSWKNNGVEKFSIDKDGNVNIPTGASYKINGTAIGSVAVTGIDGNLAKIQNNALVDSGISYALVLAGL